MNLNELAAVVLDDITSPSDWTHVRPWWPYSCTATAGTIIIASQGVPA